MKQPRFKPRNLNDEMPIVMRNISVYGGDTGIRLENTDAFIDGYISRKTKKPLQVEGDSRVILRNPDFRY